MGELFRIPIAIIRNLIENDLWATFVIAILIVGYYFFSRLLIRKIFHKKANGNTENIVESVSTTSVIEETEDYYNNPAMLYQDTLNYIYLLVEFVIVLTLFLFAASTLGLIQTDFYEVMRSALSNNH